MPFFFFSFLFFLLKHAFYKIRETELWVKKIKKNILSSSAGMHILCTEYRIEDDEILMHAGMEYVHSCERPFNFGSAVKRLVKRAT